MPEGYEYYLTQTLSVGEVPQSKTTPLVLMFDQLGDGFHSCSTKKTTPTIRSNFLMFIQSRFKKTMNTTTKTEEQNQQNPNSKTNLGKKENKNEKKKKQEKNIAV